MKIRRAGEPASAGPICPRCGRTIPQGQVVCGCSIRPRRYWLHSRETILLLCVGGLVIAFGVTGFAAKLYHGRRAELARSWFERGNAEMKAGRSAAALSDFRAALVYAQRELLPDEQQKYELDFVQALIAAGNRDEARSYLLDMWDRAPGNSAVNLELARLSVAMRNDSDAKRYYNGAIDGVWDRNAGDVLRRRLDARLELYHYLIDHGETSDAQSELLATAAALPPDASLRTLVGKLMLQDGQTRPALEQFEQALRLDSRNYDAMAGAGQAAFQLGNDRDAIRYLENAIRLDLQQKRRPGSQTADSAREAEQAQVMQDLAIAQASLTLDPTRPGLDSVERARRAIRDYDAAFARMKSCASERGIALPVPNRSLTPFTQAASNDVAIAAFARHIDQLDPLMEFISEMESTATENCGAPTDPANAAIARIGNRMRASRP